MQKTKNIKIISHLNDVLKDASFKDENGYTDWGGTSFAGETLDDFIKSIDCLSIYSSCDDINNSLKECNIKPIKF